MLLFSSSSTAPSILPSFTGSSNSIKKTIFTVWKEEEEKKKKKKLCLGALKIVGACVVDEWIRLVADEEEEEEEEEEPVHSQFLLPTSGRREGIESSIYASTLTATCSLPLFAVQGGGRLHFLL